MQTIKLLLQKWHLPSKSSSVTAASTIKWGRISTRACTSAVEDGAVAEVHGRRRVPNRTAPKGQRWRDDGTETLPPLPKNSK